MSSTPQRSRKRAVRLTPDALDALRAALDRRWQEDDRVGRLTRETRAELMGVSVVTSGRIFSGGGVDRATLAHAFKSVGLPWSDSCCESVGEEANAEKAEVFAEPPIGPSPAPDGASRRPAWMGLYAFGACALALLAAFTLVPRASVRHAAPAAAHENWGDEFNTLLYDGIARYHQADYVGCRRQLDQALALAKGHDSAMHMALVMHTEGDLSQEQGNLPDAKADYVAELKIRNDLGDRRPKPGIYQALGEVETRLGEYGLAARDLGLCLDDFRRLNDPVGIAMATGDLGSVAFGAGRLDEADALFARSLAALTGPAKSDIAFDVRGRQALVMLKRGRAEEARRTLASCLAYWTGKGHPRWIAVCELNLALAEEQLGERNRAVARLERSRAGFEAVGDGARLAEATERLRRLAPPKA